MPPYLVLACQLLVGLVFVASVSSKVRSRAAYAGFVAATGALVPAAGRRAPLLAAGTVVVEAGIALLLIPPATRRAASAAAVVLLVVFAAALAGATRRGVRTPCRCFGGSTAPPGAVQVFRNAVLAVVAALGAGLPGDGPVVPAGVGIAAFVALTGAILVAAADDLALLVRPRPGGTP